MRGFWLEVTEFYFKNSGIYLKYVNMSHKILDQEVHPSLPDAKKHQSAFQSLFSLSLCLALLLKVIESLSPEYHLPSCWFSS